ncbi:helix-turn-helix domain-containing protein [Domibacillus sp. A3M-37]
MSCQHLSTFERTRIKTLKESGCSLRDIVRRIDRSVSCRLTRTDTEQFP